MGETRTDHLSALDPVHHAARALADLTAGGAEPSVLEVLRALRELEVAVDGATDELMHQHLTQARSVTTQPPAGTTC